MSTEALSRRSNPRTEALPQRHGSVLSATPSHAHGVTPTRVVIGLAPFPHHESLRTRPTMPVFSSESTKSLGTPLRRGLQHAAQDHTVV